MPNIGRRRSPYALAGRGQGRQTGRSMLGNRGGYGQGMDRRGGARTGALSRASRPFGMRGRMGGGMNRPSGMRGGRSPLGNLGGRSIFGNRGRSNPGSRSPYSGMTTPRANRKGRFAGGSSGLGGSRRRGY
jgi:hypothetical protein